MVFFQKKSWVKIIIFGVKIGLEFVVSYFLFIWVLFALVLCVYYFGVLSLWYLAKKYILDFSGWYFRNVYYFENLSELVFFDFCSLIGSSSEYLFSISLVVIFDPLEIPFSICLLQNQSSLFALSQGFALTLISSCAFLVFLSEVIYLFRKTSSKFNISKLYERLFG
uniref:NADH dehydrogenase subunit 6 n=1 Tax=Panagrolaimus sp. ES5 TaxID=591445 RepID=A0AC34F6T6_9BILA